MSRCTDPEKGGLLHGYELGIISEEEAQQFEMHQMECDYCHRELKALHREAHYLTGDRDVLDLATQYDQSDTASQSIFGWLWQYLWPQTPLIFKPAISYLAVLTIAIAGPWITRIAMQTPVFQFAPAVALSANRSGDNVEILSKSLGRYSSIYFGVREPAPVLVHSVVIRSVNNEVITRIDDFKDYSRDGNASVTVDLTRFSTGDYELVIYSAESPGDTPIDTTIYPFRVIE